MSERRRVAYLMTHHPRVALTFVLDEIHGLEREGFEILPIAINAPDEDDRDRAGFAAEIARTRYLKSTSKLDVLRIVGRAALTSPRALLATVATSVRTAGSDLRLVVWRLFHAVEAILVWDHCRRHGVRHLHGHFAQLPSTLAWLAADFGNRREPGQWSFSATVHGPHELSDVREAAFAAKAADAEFVIAIADYTAGWVANDVAPVDRSKIHVVRCGLDLDRFPFRPRAELNDPPRVTVVGRVVELKGQRQLVDAIELLRDRGVTVAAEIIGDGADRSALEAHVAGRGLGDRVAILGQLPTEEVAARLQRTDVFCLPSLTEGIPVSIMEAMASGVPVIATAVGGIPELVDQRSGMLIPAGQPAQLADAIEALLADPLRRREMVVAARARVEADHDERRTIKELAAFF